MFMRHTNINEVNVEIKGIDTVVAANTKNTESKIQKKMWDGMKFHAEAPSRVEEDLCSGNL